MSSEESRTSSSSRLSQFGLYRTIDARTEEFLRLSKKRQIRQGCACAVISTAITITVVVVAILYYKYSGNSDPSPQLLKSDNVKKHAPKEKSSYNGYKEKLSKISPSTIKLLNLLLKALNHTSYLENREEINKPSTYSAKKDETEVPLKKNLFSNTRNIQFRIPNLKMFTAEHKTPTIFYYRKPTANVEVATKTKKPPIYPWNDLTIASEEVLKLSSMSSIKKKNQPILLYKQTTTTTPKNRMHCSESKGQQKTCNCNKLSIFLCKLLSSIQDLLPEVILNSTTLCTTNSSVINKIPKITPTTEISPLNIFTDLEIVFKQKALNKKETSKKGLTAETFNEITGKYVIAADMYKEHQTYLEKNTNKSTNGSKSGNQNDGKNKITKNPTKSQWQFVKHTTKKPEYTTTEVRPYIVAHEVVKYKKSTTTKIKSKSESQPETSAKRQATETLNKKIVTADMDKDYKNFLVNNTNKFTNASQYNAKIPWKRLLQSAIQRTSKLPEFTTSAVRPYIEAPKLVENIKSTTTATTNKIRSQHETSEKIQLTETLNKYVISAEMYQDYEKYLKSKRNKSNNASKKGSHHNANLKIPSKSLLRSIIHSTSKKPELTTTVVRPYTATSEFGKFKSSKKSITTTSTAATITKDKETRQNLYTEMLDGTKERTIKPMQPTTASIYFLDNTHLDNKLFKDIKFARFDSFAANSNKHIILPSYKDINFDFFPVYKRHNTPKLDTKSELLVNTDLTTDNDFNEIDFSRKRADNKSTLNKTKSTIPFKKYSETTNIIPIQSSLPTEEKISVNWIFKTINVKNRTKEKLDEYVNENNQEDNIVLHISSTSAKPNLPEISYTSEKHAIWTYHIDNDNDLNHYVDTKKTQIIFDDHLNKSETVNKSMVKPILFDAELINNRTNTQTVSIGHLYDTNKSLQQYLNDTLQSKTSESGKHQLNGTNYSEVATLFEDRIQEMLRSHMDTKSNANKETYVTFKNVIPNEVMVDDTEYFNPSSMLPKSRPSYLEINRNFLNADNDQDYQIYKINYKQKRQDYDSVYDMFE